MDTSKMRPSYQGRIQDFNKGGGGAQHTFRTAPGKSRKFQTSWWTGGGIPIPIFFFRFQKGGGAHPGGGGGHGPGVPPPPPLNPPLMMTMTKMNEIVWWRKDFEWPLE